MEASFRLFFFLPPVCLLFHLKCLEKLEDDRTVLFKFAYSPFVEAITWTAVRRVS